MALNHPAHAVGFFGISLTNDFQVSIVRATGEGLFQNGLQEFGSPEVLVTLQMTERLMERGRADSKSHPDAGGKGLL